MTGSGGGLSFLVSAASDMTIVSIHSIEWIYSFIHSFLERVFPLFLIFLGVSKLVFRCFFPVFSSFHLSKPVPSFLRGLKLAILEQILNENLSKLVLCHSTSRPSPFQKSFLIFLQPVFLSN